MKHKDKHATFWDLRTPAADPRNLGRVSKAFDVGQLNRRCSLSIQDAMTELGGTIVGPTGKQHAFKDNGAKVLFVAHLDVVCDQPHFDSAALTDDLLIFSTRLDDRLGYYTITDLLPRLGIVGDILLTENEERCASTAADFRTDKKYNFIIQFDRRGEDVVCYDYLPFEPVMREYFQVGKGSYTDIRELEHLGVCAANIACGYHDEHTQTCYMSYNEYTRQLARFMTFYHRNKGKRYTYAPRFNQPTKGKRQRDEYRARGYWERIGTNLQGTIQNPPPSYYLTDSRDADDMELCLECNTWLFPADMSFDEKTGQVFCLSCGASIPNPKPRRPKHDTQTVEIFD